jgi:hypothetical protein
MDTGLSNLFKFKDELTIINPKTGKPTKNKVWIRLLGDDDIKKAYEASRVASAEKRAALRNLESDERKAVLAQLSDLSQESLKELIIAEAENGFISQAPVVVERQNLPEIEEVAAEPDAPTLEEQEILDRQTADQDKEFLDSITEYVETKKRELEVELSELTDEQIFERATKTIENIQPLQAFAEELADQKGFRGTYLDKECKIKGFKDLQDFKDSHTAVKQQIIAKYESLEMGNDDIKE